MSTNARGDEELAVEALIESISGSTIDCTADESEQSGIAALAQGLDYQPMPTLAPVPPMPVLRGPRTVAHEATSPTAGDVSKDSAPIAKPSTGASTLPVKGWVSLDADLVFRGWAMKVGACEEKLEVSLFIDGELISTSRAEDFRQDLPCSDKRHGFKFAVPAIFLDSSEHSWCVRAGHDGPILSSKASTFSVGLGAAPVISVERIAPDIISGSIACAKLIKCGNPNLWTGADPVAVPQEANVWAARGSKGIYPFDIPINEKQFNAALSQGLRVAIPGDRTGERAIEIPPSLKWAVRKDCLVVSVGAPFELRDGLSSRMTLSQRERGVVVTERIDFASDGSAEFRLPAELLETEFSAHLGDAAIDVAAPSARYEYAAARKTVLNNWDFSVWQNGGPAEWVVASDVKIEHRFSSSTHTGLTAAAGDTMLLWAGNVQHSGQALLRQDLVTAAPQNAFVGLVARAAQKCELELLLLDQANLPLVRLPLTLTRQWQTFVFESQLGEGVLRAVELRRLAVDPPWVELAALDIAPSARSLFSGSDDEHSKEIIANPSVQGWLPSTFPVVCRGRTQLAQGWWAVAPEGAQLVAYPVPLTVLAPNAKPGKFALAVSANETGRASRIEARIDRLGLEAGQRYSLSFRASATYPSDGSLLPRHRKWPVVDRILMMTRDRKSGAGRVAFECARRTYLSSSRALTEVEFELTRADVDALSAATDDAVVGFEFHAPFQITLDSISIKRISAPRREDPGLVIALEDGDIAAQAASTKGCEHWVLPVARKLNDDVHEGAESESKFRRWSWKYRDLGTIEIVICVFNAIDETLQCLRSLVRETGIPHTVTVIDDGSDASGVERIEDFIRDKPWMRLHRNGTNLGYTKSADLGVRSSASDWVVLLNSDTIVSPGWLEGLLEVAASHPDVAMVGPVSNAASFQSVPELYDAGGQWSTNELPVGTTIAEMSDLVRRVSLKEFPRVPLLNGFCTLIRRSVFIEIGGFDVASFPKGYGEENDLCLRARDQGHLLAVADHVYVYHVKSASFGKEKRAELSKVGNQRLREKHPTVDFARLGREFADVTALATLRQRVRDALRERQALAEPSS